MIKKEEENVWKIKKEGKMKVPGKVFASDNLMEKIERDKTLEQIKNVACLPGIVDASLAMPDAHQGYGFPIGGVAAFDMKKGVISPGGVGYDINCGVRLLSSNLDKSEFLAKRNEVLDELYKNVPSGVGKKSEFRLTDNELKEVLEKGVDWAIEKGFGSKEDADKTEDTGRIAEANAEKVSQKARGRGMNQLGSLGAGNHFLEVQEVEEIFDKDVAKVFGIKKRGQIMVMVHCGSRGLGHQVASDYIKKMEEEYGFENLPDRELICAPIDSKLGKDYRMAMNAAANFAFANRHIIMHQIRESFKKYFPETKMKLVYDIAHNIAKFEDYEINGEKKTLCVHRKGATRSFGKGRKEIPKDYRKVGCPIFIPGSMGTYSYVLVGTKQAEKVSFASTAHGAGRVLSRSFAMRNLNKEKVEQKMKDHDVILKAGSLRGIMEEAPEAYKDVDELVRVSHELGIGNLVAKLKPLGVVKG